MQNSYSCPYSAMAKKSFKKLLERISTKIELSVASETSHSYKQEAQLMLTNPRDAFSGQSRSPHIVPFHMLGIVSSCAIVTLSLRGAVFTIFDFKKLSWPWNRGQRSLKVIEIGTIRKIVYGFLLVFFSNIVPKMHRFWDIRLQNCHDLENRVRGPSRSLDMSPCDRAHMTSYRHSIVTMECR